MAAPRRRARRPADDAINKALEKLSTPPLEIHVDLGDRGPSMPSEYEMHSAGLTVDDGRPFIVKVRWPRRRP